MSLHVLKFGGTSVGSAAAITNLLGIVSEGTQSHERLVVVVSAMSGVTDMLRRGANSATTGDTTTFTTLATDIERKHMAAALELVPDEQERAAVMQNVNKLLEEFRMLCHSVQVIGELTPRALDAISSLGERMSAPLVAAALRHHGLPASAFDATTIIVTDDRFGDAAPLMERTRQRAQAELVPTLERGTIPVVTGYIGATENGATTTLGRGASDFTASIIGAVLDADLVSIYTDVDGVMTADPRNVPHARVLPTLSYEEIGELAFFGAKVLQPKAIRPIVERDIALVIRNTFNPQHPGTAIIRQARAANGVVKAVTAIRDMSIITVAGRGMLGIPGVAARTFGAVAHVNASCLMISQASSEQSICFVVPTAAADSVTSALESELRAEVERRDIDGIAAQNDVVIVTVVGAGMRGTPGVAGEVFGILGRERINIHAIAQGSSECSISLVVDRADAEAAVAKIHDQVIVV